MKFAILALVATASAIKIQGGPAAGPPPPPGPPPAGGPPGGPAGGPPPCPIPGEASDAIFESIDTNGDGQVSEAELVAGIKAAVAHGDLDAAQVASIKKYAPAAAGTDHTLSEPEFNALANQVMCS